MYEGTGRGVLAMRGADGAGRAKEVCGGREGHDPAGGRGGREQMSKGCTDPPHPRPLEQKGLCEWLRITVHSYTLVIAHQIPIVSG